jgi:hypothetical protein
VEQDKLTETGKKEICLAKQVDIRRGPSKDTNKA